jgi:flagellar hook-length control protein FliK
MNVTPQPLPAQPASTAPARKPHHPGNKEPRDNGNCDGAGTSSSSSATTTSVESSDTTESTCNGGESTESTSVTFADVLAALMTNVVQTQTDPNAAANADGAVISLTDRTTAASAPTSPALALEALQVLGVSTTTPETPASDTMAMPTTPGELQVDVPATGTATSTANSRTVEATADNIHAGKKSAPVSGPTSGTSVVETATNVSGETATPSEAPAIDTTPPTTFGPATMAPLDRTITIRDPRMPGQLPRSASEFAQQLVGQLTPLRTSGSGTYALTLQLRPEGLGSVNVDVRLKDGTIDLNFRVQAPETREMVRMSIGDLRSQLDQAGVNSGHVDVGDMAREFGRQQNDATSDTNAKLNDLFADEEADSSITPAAVQGRAATSTTDRAVNVHL